MIARFYRAKKQDLAQMAQDEMDRIEKNKAILEEMRREKREKDALKLLEVN